MDEARAVMRRLDRIEALEREGTHPQTLLAELRALVHEAEAWVRVEGDGRARDAVERCKDALRDGEAARREEVLRDAIVSM
jgi:hypothetical protein